MATQDTWRQEASRHRRRPRCHDHAGQRPVARVSYSKRGKPKLCRPPERDGTPSL